MRALLQREADTDARIETTWSASGSEPYSAAPKCASKTGRSRHNDASASAAARSFAVPTASTSVRTKPL